MSPLSFDPVTARVVVGDAEARVIEAKARADADAERFDPPRMATGGTYWEGAQSQMAAVVYREQFTKRRARIERKAAAA